jgi:ribonuclease HI
MLGAIKELEQRGFTNVMLETDSKNVANAIHFINNGVSDGVSEFSFITSWTGARPKNK